MHLKLNLTPTTILWEPQEEGELNHVLNDEAAKSLHLKGARATAKWKPCVHCRLCVAQSPCAILNLHHEMVLKTHLHCSMGTTKWHESDAQG